MEPVFLSLDDVLETHAEQIATDGGGDGLRDLSLLQSALAQPEATFDGKYLHADLFEMAAAYLFHIVLNQARLKGQPKPEPPQATSTAPKSVRKGRKGGDFWKPAD